jgi:hypothetical protein
MSIPSAAGLRLDLGEAGAYRRIGNTDKMLARGTLNLPTGELRFAFQWLVTMRAVKLEFVCVHKLHPHHAQTGCEKYMKDLFILFLRRMRM